MEDSKSKLESIVRQAVATAEYRDPERTVKDILDVLSRYPGLNGIFENYVYNDGSEQLLLGLTGSIPVQYMGNFCDIPIGIWLYTTYPNDAPMVFVKPTSEIRLKMSERVLGDGKVNLPYLRDWYYADSELLELIHVLILAFEEHLPVYAEYSPSQLLSASRAGALLPYPRTPLNYPAKIQMDPHGISEDRFELLSSVTEKLSERLCASFESTCIEENKSSRLKAGNEGLKKTLNRMIAEREILEIDVETCQDEIAYLDARISRDAGDVEFNENQEQILKLDCGVSRDGSDVQFIENKDEIVKPDSGNSPDGSDVQFIENKVEIMKLDPGTSRDGSDVQLIENKVEIMKLDPGTSRDGSDIELNNKPEEIMEPDCFEVRKEDTQDSIFAATPLYKQIMSGYAEDAALESAIDIVGEAFRRGKVDLEQFEKSVKELARKQFLVRAQIAECREKAGLVQTATDSQQ